ncbi:pantetheine-phosphate adenylyltransferase [Treponema zioleckii]|uniref:pantetheine-phosphate adenylyltransferase n=1 Tax=Treponema zioleckii TaxID=331680 RepID=UPI00168BC3C5|nr:pantetheine-phosphate adenylyltransferase [Treponema zioleckii]
MVEAIFPGSFDPLTNGHLNIIERAAKIFDTVDVVIAVNPKKNSFFTVEERIDFIKKLTAGYENVFVHTWDKLIVDYAKQNGKKVIVRGIRNHVDYDYEFELSIMNHRLAPDVETIFLPTEQKFSIVKSSAIKELASFGGDISGMVPEIVKDALLAKLKVNR